jgi:hypothetical protein
VSTAVRALRRALLRIAWLAAAVAIAAGSAGIVAAVGGPAGSGDHPELTWAGDQAIKPGLDATLDDLRGLSNDVERLGTLGRGALASLAARDSDQLRQAIDDGSQLVGSIGTTSSEIRRRLRALPGVNGLAPPLPGTAAITLGAATRARYAALDAALSTTQGLSAAWLRLTAGSLAASRLAGVLADHDLSTAAAARLGGGAHYAAALDQLDTSDSLIAEAGKERDTLANAADVSTLGRWIDLNAAYDKALRHLYATLRASHGRATPPVRDAIAGEQAAHDQLPPDTRALVVIMGELARGGINQAVIAIEEARGDLDAAIDALAATG